MAGVTITLQVPVEGPAPAPPVYTLRGAADVVDDLNGRNPETGVIIDPAPVVKAARFALDDSCDPHYIPPGGTDADDAAAKGAGTYGTPVPFNPITVVVELACSAAQIHGASYTRLVQRAKELLSAVEMEAVEREFYGGALYTAMGIDMPHLTSDMTAGPGTEYATAKPPLRAIAILENDLAEVYGRGGGVIHCTPGLHSMLGAGGAFNAQGGKIRTPNGTLVVPGFGYVNAGDPESASAAATGEQEWVWATGPVELRQGQVYTDAQSEVEALARSTNDVLIRAERAFVYSWDAEYKSGILVDRSA